MSATGTRESAWLAAALVMAGACGGGTKGGTADHGVPPDGAASAETARGPEASVDLATCMPGAFLSCSGSTAVYCTTAGVGTTTKDCAFGCDAKLGGCDDLVPSNQAAAHLASGDTFTCTGTQSPTLPAVTVAAGAALAIDTSAGTLTNGGTPVSGALVGSAYMPAGSGTSARVFHIHSLTLGNGATVSVTGSSALVLLVDQDVTATGTASARTFIDVSSSTSRSRTGPGSITSTAGAAGGNGSGGGGGGGAGHDAAGGAGGAGSAGSAPGGTSYGTGTGEALEAGARGGLGGGIGFSVGGLYGWGGGALEVTACGTISLAAGVVVNASGSAGGGGPASPALGFLAAGGGGGSGGTILVEASQVSVPGWLVSNGGGGGGGGGSFGVGAGGSGQEWNPSTPPSTAAMGGMPAGGGTGSGSGGGGGAGTAPVGQPGQGDSTNLGGGGGGGASGVIFINVPSGATDPVPGAASPAPTYGTTCSSARSCPH